MRQAPLHLIEDRGVGRVAPKIMIKLPGAVVVAGSGGEQAEAVRQRTQLVARVKIMILMIDFDAIQPVITDECLEHPRREDVLASPPPRMGDHGKAARLVYQVYAAIHFDRVAVNMRWSTISQKAIERLLPIAYVARLDQRVSDVRATDRWTLADLGHHVRFAHRHTKLRQFRQDTR